MVRSTRRFTDEQLIDLYDQGLVDRVIGEKLGSSTSIVWESRVRLGLKANGIPRIFSDQQLIDLHIQGLTDIEISKKLGSSSGSVWKHRNRLGLKINHARDLDNKNL